MIPIWQLHQPGIWQSDVPVFISWSFPLHCSIIEIPDFMSLLKISWAYDQFKINCRDGTHAAPPAPISHFVISFFNTPLRLSHSPKWKIDKKQNKRLLKIEEKRLYNDRLKRSCKTILLLIWWEIQISL